MIGRRVGAFGVGLVVSGGLFWAALASAPVPPPAPESPAVTQVAAGQAVFTRSCQGCHGDNLQGGRGPALQGARMLGAYTGAHPFANLHAKVSKTMPRNAPGSLSAQQYLDVVAFLLARNGVTLPVGGLRQENLKELALTAREAQVTAGQAVYVGVCQGCHGNNLQGGRAPTLLGAALLTKYATVAGLHAKVSRTMPRNAPGSLDAQQYLDVVAFLLNRNGVPSGAAALSVDGFDQSLK